ncbi:hypothetical protein TRAPUB_5061 [Trametes pubescens]|uniref:F-box domain-containing protein n=1 Tax=Trametes pubescens TaxID=154538 RepID=A0A1M2W781_TRAPU|nr:hypothetical protein TRAPUB_5061 [Trametes pubescens]
MDSIRLNIDILLVVLSFTDKDTTLQLMQTCRTLNHYGAKYLLAECVTLDTESTQAVVSFLHFLSRDPPYRLARVHRLELTRSPYTLWPTPEAEEAGRFLTALFRVLARDGSLESLSIDDVEAILDLKEDLAGAISMVRTLKTIHLTYVGPRAAEMLRMSQSTLEDVDIAMDSDYEDTTEEDDDNNDEDNEEDDGEEDDEDEEEELPRLNNRRLTHILSNSRNSLHTLGMWGSGGVHDGPRYPLLADLFIGYVDKPRTRNHVHASPNLRYLMAIDCNTSDDFSVSGAYERLRSKNQREQARYGTWSSLWHFSGVLSTLFVLAPACPIHALDIAVKEGVSEAVVTDKNYKDPLAYKIPWKRRISLLLNDAVLKIFIFEGTMYAEMSSGYAKCRIRGSRGSTQRAVCLETGRTGVSRCKRVRYIV